MSILEQAQKAQQDYENKTEQELPTPKTRLEILKENYETLKKTSEEKAEIISALILYLQELDIEEYRRGERKNYNLMKFIKNEFVILSAQKGCQTASLELNTQAAKALCGLAIITEDNTITYNLIPLNRKRFLVKFKINSEQMRNCDIYYYNETFNLNIPLNERNQESIPDDEQFQQDVLLPAWLTGEKTIKLN